MKTVSARPGVIYALKDPKTNQVRYIGKTVDLPRRTREYRSPRCRRRMGNPHLVRWFDKLTRQDAFPEVVILQTTLPGMIDACEEEWIAKGRAKGWRLINNEAKARLSALGKAKWAEPAYRERCTKAMLNRPGSRKTPEQREAESIAKAAGMAKHAANMALHAQRQQEKAERASWVFAPLTCKGIAFVPLTQGMWATVDADNWPKVSGDRWYANQNFNGKLRPRCCDKSKAPMSGRVFGIDKRVRYHDGNPLNLTRANVICV